MYFNVFIALFKATRFLNMRFTNNAKDGFIPTDDWIIEAYTTSLELASVLEDIAGTDSSNHLALFFSSLYLTKWESGQLHQINCCDLYS